MFCSIFPTVGTVSAAPLPAVFEELQHYLNTSSDLDKEHIEQLRAFYARENFDYLWFDQEGLLPRAQQLLHYLIEAEQVGLHAEDYPVGQLREAMSSRPVEDPVHVEWLLTKALLLYCQHLQRGRYSPQDMDPDWHIFPSPLNFSKVLEQLLADKPLDDILKGLQSRHKGYQALLLKLHQYTDIAQQGGWLLIPSGPILRSGMKSDRIALIRQRLRITGDLVAGPSGDPNQYDRVLREAVMRFQVRHGIGIDGATGPQTLAAMNIPVAQRIRQIKLNLERWRWLPDDLGQRYLLVNMSGFELYAEEQDGAVLAMPIIIGKTYRSTPTFRSLLRRLEVNPYWTIPKKIILEDLIPLQLRDADYFARKHIRVFDGWGEDSQELDINDVPLRKLNDNYFPYRFRQDPGVDNSLGRVKFLFPNPYDVYLHDTPQRNLFDRRVRTFSSGCIRVRDPVRLIAYLLNTSTQEKEEQVLSLIYRDQNRGLSLPKPLPIYLIYWTAWVDQQGIINFSDDVYNRDKRLLEVFQ